MNVAGAYRAHLVASVRHYAPATIDKRCAAVRHYTQRVAWATASPLDVETYLESLTLSTSAVRDRLSHLRMFYRWAVRQGLASGDPCAGVEQPRTPRRLPRPARDVAVSVAVQAAAAAGDRHMVAMLSMMAGAGLRCCEVAALRWVDVDLIAGTVHIIGKGAHERVVHLSPELRRQLAAIDADTVHVFQGPQGPYSASRVSQLVNAHLRRCAASCTAHQLRHRFATAALASCGDLSVVRDLLGHASVATTEVYAQVTAGAAGKVSASMHVPGL